MKIIQALIRRRLDAAGGMAIDNMYTKVSCPVQKICGQLWTVSRFVHTVLGQDTRTPAGLLQRYRRIMCSISATPMLTHSPPWRFCRPPGGFLELV